MKLKINEDPSVEELEVTINCKQIDDTVCRLLSMLRVLDQKIVGVQNQLSYILEITDILYIDTVDKKTFLYTKQQMYETPLKLYELEEQLAPFGFFRASKSCIINFNQIKSLKADLDGKILVILSNQEKLLVSKQYASTIKKKLGVK